MRNSLLFKATLAAALLLGSFREAKSFEAPRELRGRELQALLLGNTLIGLDQDGAFWIYYPNADTLWGRSSSGDVDVGRWWIENDSYCRLWRRWHDGQTRCWQVARRGNDELLWYSLGGDQDGRSYVLEGNAIGKVLDDAVVQLTDAGISFSSESHPVVALEAMDPKGWTQPRRRTAERQTSENKNEYTLPAKSGGSSGGKIQPPWPAILFVQRFGSLEGAGEASAAAREEAAREAAAREAAAREAAAREAAARETAAREAAAREAAAREAAAREAAAAAAAAEAAAREAAAAAAAAEAAAREAAAREAAATAAVEAAAREAAAAAAKAREKQSSRSSSGGNSGGGNRGSKSGSDRDHGE